MNTNTVNNDDLVLDLWYGGSVLYGWDIAKQCVDRLPIAVDNPNTVTLLGGTPVELNLKGELLGTESDYESKITCEGRVGIQRDWVAELTRRKWYASNGWCSLFRSLVMKKRSVLRTFFGDLRYIDVKRKIIYIIPHGLIEYERVVNSLPLEYITHKIASYDRKNQFQVKYVTLYVTMAILRGDYEPHVWFLGKRRFTSSAIVSLPLKLIYPNLYLGENYLTLAYAFVPQLMGELNPDIRQKTLADFKRLGLNIKNAVLIRSHFERYGYLGQNTGVGNVINLLRDYGIECVGRLGKWRELGIEEILMKYSSLLKQ